VITIKSQSSPRNATRYFSEHLSHDDYYSEKEQTAGRWYGKTCDAFGIQPESTVEKDQFTALCKGLRPDDLTKLTQRQKENRRCLYDLTASAPKSVSIMALVGGDARLIAAHEKAVTAALEAAEAGEPGVAIAASIAVVTLDFSPQTIAEAPAEAGKAGKTGAVLLLAGGGQTA